jgi:hypothetical protein
MTALNIAGGIQMRRGAAAALSIEPPRGAAVLETWPVVAVRSRRLGVMVALLFEMAGRGWAPITSLLPSGVIAFRFMDEGDMNIDPLVRRVENLRSSCQ